MSAAADPQLYPRRERAYINAACRRGLAAALQALDAPAPELTTDELLAERERLRVEAEAARQRQGVLRLGRAW